MEEYMIISLTISAFKMASEIFVVPVSILLLLSLFISGCSSKEGEVRDKFQEACPQPGWWDDVSIIDVNINSYDDLLTYWQNKERTNNQFFKAAYQAIVDHPLNDDIVVNAINLMPYGDRGYPYIEQMLEFAANNYFDYDRPLAQYGGKVGDAIAGIIEELVGIYNGKNKYQESIELINRLIEKRESEINDHILELLSLKLAEAYFETGNKEKAIEILNKAIDKYDGSWEKKLREQLEKYK
jgi:tetratricopeptide (TPR) repeat protein